VRGVCAAKPDLSNRYQYPDNPEDLGQSISGAKYVEDVNEDPVVIINGLTKGFR
jgi:hypothetical protein